MTAPQFVSRKTLAEMFDTSVTTVRRWEASGVIPRPKTIGSLERWNLAELMRHVGEALDAPSGRGGRSVDPDTAAERAYHAARKDRPSHARRR